MTGQEDDLPADAGTFCGNMLLISEDFMNRKCFISYQYNNMFHVSIEV
jgi:hypothetical protein